MDRRPVAYKRGWLALRWIGVVPCAVVGGLAASMVVKLINEVIFSWQGLNRAALLSRLYLDGVYNGVFSAAAIYLGAKVAPSHRRMVALALLVAVLVLVGLFGMFASILRKKWWDVYLVGAFLVAGGAVAWWIYTRERYRTPCAD